MQIDITKLLTHYIDTIEINEEVKIPDNILENSLITNLKDIKLDGELFLDEDDNLNLTGKSIKFIFFMFNRITAIINTKIMERVGSNKFINSFFYFFHYEF